MRIYNIIKQKYTRYWSIYRLKSVQTNKNLNMYNLVSERFCFKRKRKKILDLFLLT